MNDLEITSDVVAQARKAAGLSREKFAQQTGLTPGAVWRIEAKSQFKPGDREKLATWLDGKPLTPLPPRQITRRAVTVVDADPISPTPQDVLGLTTVEFIQTFEVTPQTIDALKPAFTLPPLAGTDESPTNKSKLDGKWRVSNSEVQTWKRCRRKWWFTYYRTLRPKHESPVGALALGSRVHEALRYAYLADPTQRMDPRDALEALIYEDYRLLVHQLNEPGRFESVQDVIKQFQREADLERVMIAGYIEWLAETGADSELEITGSEVYLEAELPELPHVLIIARLDARVRRIVDGVRMFVDHKTVGDFTGPAKTLHMDEQMMWYMLIERLQNDPTPVAGALYNMLKKTKRSQKATPPFYKRIEVHHNPITIEHFRERLYGTLITIMSARHRLDEGTSHRVVAYPTPKRDCAWDCPFFSVCGMTDDGSHAEGMIKQFFTIGDPLSYYVRGTATSQSSD